MAIRTKTGIKLKASAECPTRSRLDVAFRDPAFAIDEPAERGGTNLGPTPTDTALAALIGCIDVIGHKYASKMSVDIGQLKVGAECDFDRRGATLEEEIEALFLAVAETVTLSGSASPEDLNRVVEMTEKYCPLSKLFRAAETRLEVVWQAA